MEKVKCDLEKTIDAIAKQTKNLSWDDISEALKLDEERADSVSQLSFVGRLISRRTLSSQVFHPITCSGWRFGKEFKIDNVGQNWFLFTFSSLLNKERILKQTPWNFKGSLRVLKEWKSYSTINDIDLSTALFWVQIHRLPLRGLERENVTMIGSKIGEVKAVQ